MRLFFRILKWMGLGLSMVLLLVTVVLWVRSLGHVEVWSSEPFIVHPDGEMEFVDDCRVTYAWEIDLVNGRLCLVSRHFATPSSGVQRIYYRRGEMSAEHAERDFYAAFKLAGEPFSDGSPPAWRFAGLGLLHWRMDADPEAGRLEVERFALAIPLWMPTVLFALWPALFTTRRLLRRRRRNFRIKHNLCLHCGYDLRATPLRCPECGNAVEPVSKDAEQKNPHPSLLPRGEGEERTG